MSTVEAREAVKSESSNEGGSEPLPCVVVHGLGFHAITEDQLVNHVISAVQRRKRTNDAAAGGWIVTANLEYLRRTTVDPAFKKTVEGADIIVADGMPIIWAAKVQGTPLPQRIAGSTFFLTFANAAERERVSIFLLGGDPGVADAAATALRAKHPALDIRGTYCPPYLFEQDAAEVEKIVSMLSEAQPDVVFVAISSPRQDRFIEMVRQRLPGAWWVGVGITFSFAAGTVKRAPRWMQKVGLEWTHRLMQEPRKLAKRYLVYGIPFGLRLMMCAMWRRVRG